MDISNVDLKKIKYIIIAVILLVSVAAYAFFEKNNGDDRIVMTERGMETEQIQETGKVNEINREDNTETGQDRNQEEKTITEPDPEYIYVDVSGAVNSPMVVCIPFGSRVFEAIDAAGGRNNESSVKYLNLASVCEDGQKIYVPTLSEIDAAEAAGEVLPGQTENSSDSLVLQNAGEEGRGTKGQDSSGGKVNINTAGSEELQTLPGVGPAIASRIIDYRNTRGSFQSVEEIKSVSGIGEKIYEKLKDEICV